MADVAAALGHQPALVFYHFETKDRLLAEAFAHAVERDLARLDKAVARGAARPRSGCARILALYAPQGSTPPGWTLWVDAWAAALRSPELRTVSRRLDLRWKEALAERSSRTVGARASSPAPTRTAPPGASPRCIDGLAVQVTVHRGVSPASPDGAAGCARAGRSASSGAGRRATLR